MSKTNRRRRAKKRRRPARRTTRARQHTSAEPDLLADVRRALADPAPAEPVDLREHAAVRHGLAAQPPVRPARRPGPERR